PHDRGLRRRLPRLGTVRVRSARLLPELQVPPATWARVLLRALPELPDDGRRRSERARVRRADPGGRPRACAERARLTRPRPALRRRSRRRAVHAGRLLLPHDDPAASALAVLRAPAPEPRRPRPRRRRGRAALRRRAPPR